MTLFPTIKDPALRAAFLAAYRGWKRSAQQLDLFDEAGIE